MDFRVRIVSWTDVEKWCSSIRDQIIDGFVPDMIIGLSRGGLVPARILSDTLWIKDLISIKTEHWGITATKSGKAILRDPGKLNLNGRKVLIVDDITDTGQSMKLAYDFVKSQEPAEVRTATMLHITRSSFIPDFYGELVEQKNWAWFIFPWNVYEDLDNLFSKVMNGRASLQELKTLLLENFDLKVEDSLLETVINDFVKAGRMASDSGVYSKEKITSIQ